MKRTITGTSQRKIDTGDALPPHDETTEAAALACVLSATSDDANMMLAELITDDFYDHRHRIICGALVTLRESGKALDMPTLYLQLLSTGKLAEAGGLDYVQRLPNSTTSPAQWPSWLEGVRAYRQRREDLIESVRLRASALNGAVETKTANIEDDRELARLATLPPLEYEREREVAAKRIGCRTPVLDSLVDARRPKAQLPATVSGSKVTFVEPWPDPVNGADLLNDIAAFYERHVVLPTNASDVLAAWVLLSWCYELFDFAAIVAVWSPEHACGKGRVLDVTEKIVRRSFRTSNTSAAVLYHVISKGNLTVLVDEFDSISEEQRSAICNILKGGFQSNGTAHRMDGKHGEQVAMEFPTYCPKMIATITLDKLDKATRSRTIGIHMQKKPRSQKVAKFRRVNGTEIQRKCLRWAQDNAEAIKAVPPLDVDECATDRQEDVWEPLVAIGRVAGGDWEPRIRFASAQLAGGSSDGASETVAHQLLASFQMYFKEHGDRANTKAIVAVLNDTGEFADANYGRGLTPHYVAKLLKPYGIEPRVHKSADGKAVRGYSREDCESAFSTYLCAEPPKTAVSKCNSVGTSVNTGDSSLFESVTKESGYTSQNSLSAQRARDSYGVTLPEAEKEGGPAKELVEADMV